MTAKDQPESIGELIQKNDLIVFSRYPPTDRWWFSAQVIEKYDGKSSWDYKIKIRSTDRLYSIPGMDDQLSHKDSYIYVVDKQFFEAMRRT